MPFIYQRTVRFQDTDAASVVYFANALAMCHEAYEESLATSGINLKLFFSNPNVAIPIVHANVDFFRPMFCGDKVSIHLSPCQLGNDNFEINYIIMSADERQITKAITRHVCINPVSRSRQELSNQIMLWLQQWGS
ncbi:MAG TPA: 1,4-dihydroxy-2-naphthoyl-CoA hydrolase [Cyanobacteria bacterium UBA11049]|nr:1,4-dihydroxy-2-naphthoyl-CoA hydrolase [Cyanobacteria bacterium UBA11049]